MNRPKAYLDTSVISALFDERTPERMFMTETAWSRLNEYDVYISDLVFEEICMANQLLKDRMLESIKRFERLPISDSAVILAQMYIEQGIFPNAYYDDALHVALASVNNINYLLSWNYKHLVKVKTRKMVALANALADYPAVEIITPPEL